MASVALNPERLLSVRLWYFLPLSQNRWSQPPYPLFCQGSQTRLPSWKFLCNFVSIMLDVGLYSILYSLQNKWQNPLVFGISLCWLHQQWCLSLTQVASTYSRIIQGHKRLFNIKDSRKNPTLYRIKEMLSFKRHFLCSGILVILTPWFNWKNFSYFFR